MTDLIWIGNTLYPRWFVLLAALVIVASPIILIRLIIFVDDFFVRREPRFNRCCTAKRIATLVIYGVVGAVFGLVAFEILRIWGAVQ